LENTRKTFGGLRVKKSKKDLLFRPASAILFVMEGLPMLLTIVLGLGGVLCIMTQPLRLVAKPNYAGFFSKACASLLFCLAGAAAAWSRESLSWQAAAMLLGFCLAAVGDVLLAAEPVLKNPEKSRGLVFALGGAAFVLAHGINLAALCSRTAFSAWLLPLLAVLPALYLILWQRRILNLGKNGTPIMVYALLLGAMLWAAAGILIDERLLGLLALPAVILLAFSDTFVFYGQFGRKRLSGTAFSWLVMFPYYIAQTMMACIVIYI